MMTNPWHRMPAPLRKIIKVAIIVVGSIAVLDLGAVITFSLIRPTIPAHVDAVVVLGAKVGTPALTQRTLTGLSYYEQGRTDTIVLSGSRGGDEPTSEAQAMADIIKSQIEKTHGKMPHLILDTQSSDTFENLRNSKSLVPNAKSIILVSDGFHIARSLLIAKHVGFQHVYWASPTPTYYNPFDLIHYYVREAIAIIAQSPRLI